MIWILLTLAHLAGLVGYTLLLRKSTLGKLNKLVMSALMMTAMLIPSLLFLALGKVNFVHSPLEWFFLTLAGFTLTGYFILNTYALTFLDASIYTIIFNLRLVGTTILGFLILNELPRPLQMLGGLIIFASIILLNLHKNKQWKSKPVLLGFFTMIWFCFHVVLEKYNLLHINLETYFFFIFFTGTIWSWLFVALKRIKIKNEIVNIKDKKIYWLLITRIISGYTYTYALKFGSLAIINYVSGMSVALIVLFGIYILGEKEKITQKLFAVAVACLGLTLILISKL